MLCSARLSPDLPVKITEDGTANVPTLCATCGPWLKAYTLLESHKAVEMDRSNRVSVICTAVNSRYIRTQWRRKSVSANDTKETRKHKNRVRKASRDVLAERQSTSKTTSFQATNQSCNWFQS